MTRRHENFDPVNPRRIRRLALLLALCLAPFSFSLAAAEEDNSPHVGPLGDLGCIQFDGAKYFSTNELQRALRHQLDYILAAEPDRPLNELIQTIEDLLHSGYQRAGFGESKVNVGLNSSSNGIMVRIIEGPQLYCGEIRVSGLRTIATNELIRAIEQELKVSYTTNGALVHKTTQQEDAVWDPEGSAALDPASWESIETAVTNAFGRLGYPFAEFTVDFTRRPAEFLSAEALSRTNGLSKRQLQHYRARADGRLVDMVVQANREGPLAAVADVEVLGSTNSLRADVMRFLGLKIGERFTEQWRTQQVARLEDSGRFVSVSADHKGGEQDGRIVAVFTLADLPEAPPLSASLSADGEALLRLRRWLLDWQKRGEDMVFRLSSNHGTNAFEFIASPAGKVFARFTFQRRDPADPRLTFDLLAGRGLVAMQCSQLLKQFLTTNFQGTLTLFLGVNVGADAAEGESRSGITIGAGFESKSEGKPPLTTTLKLMPAFFTYLARRPDYVWQREGTTLTGTDSNVVVRLDGSTGRLLSLGGHDTDTKEGALFREVEWSLRFEENYLSRAEADWRRSGGSLSNACNERCAFSSGLAFLAEAVCRTVIPTWLFRTNLPPERLPQAKAVMGKLFRPDLFEPGVEIFAAINRDRPEDASFPIVALAGTRELTARQPLAGGVAIVLAHLPEFVPDYSWANLALRARLLAFIGKGDRMGPRTRRFFENDQFGPIAALVIGSQLNSQTARNLAVQGLVRADAAGFMRDMASLLDERCAVGRMVGKFGEVLARLDEKDLETLASALGEPEARLVRRCAASFREAPAKPLSDRLQPALEEWWNRGAKDRVKAELRRMMREG